MLSKHEETMMPGKQGDVGLLRNPVAQQLLSSKSLAHLASKLPTDTKIEQILFLEGDLL